MSHLGDLARLRAYQSAFAASIPDVRSDAPVASCGDWTVRDLVHHLAEIHVWAAGRARGSALALPPSPDLVAHYTDAAVLLVEVLDSLDPDATCWTLLDDDAPDDRPRIGTVRFWHRRQANETLVHLWDLRAAGGADLDVSEPEWLDCLDEVVGVMHPRQVRLGRIAPPVVEVAFAVDAAPVLRLGGTPAGAERVVARGSARELSLLAWGRVDAGTLEVDGDPDALERGLTGIVP